jgi:hypothetical protein
MSEIRWDVAEVLEYDHTYQYDPPTEQSSGNTNSLFTIKVRTATSIFNNEVFDVRPSNINLTLEDLLEQQKDFDKMYT